MRAVSMHIARIFVSYDRYMDGMSWCADAMRVAKHRLELATSDLAGAQTDGFRRSVAVVTADASGLHERVAAVREASPLRPTGRALDLAVAGGGTLSVRDAQGRESAVHAASFERGADGVVRDERGRTLIGADGPLHVPEGELSIGADGVVRSGDVIAGKVRIEGGMLRSGFAVASDVDPVAEMVAMIDAQRAFEGAEKALAAIDATREKAVQTGAPR